MIESYRFGQMVVDGIYYTRDLVVLPRRVIPEWWRGEGHVLAPEDLSALVHELPSVVVIGTGMFGMMRVTQESLDLLATRGIVVVVERTGIAWKRFNQYVRRGEAVAGAFHLTC